MLQTVLFDRKKYTIASAVKWLSNYGLTSKKVDVQKNFLRFRQSNPKPGYKYYTIPLPNGIKLVYQHR